MVIVQVIYSLDMGGIEEFAVNLASSFAGGGSESYLLNLSTDRDAKWCGRKRDSAEGAGVKLIDVSGVSKPMKLLKLTSALCKVKPDIVIVHHERNALRVLPAKILSRFRIIQIQHSTEINSVWRHRLAGRHIVDKFIGDSADVCGRITKEWLLREDKVVIIEPGILTGGYKRGKQKENLVTVLAVGRFVKEKNFHALAGIFIELLSGKTDFPVEIIMAGDGETYESVKRMLVEYPQVSMPGNVVDMKALYEKSDIYVSFSLYEGFSLALLEAMASGCSVICTATSGSRDIIKSGENGILTDIGDDRKFLQKLTELVNNPGRRKKLSSAAVNTAKGYDFTIIYGKYMKLLEELTSN